MGITIISKLATFHRLVMNYSNWEGFFHVLFFAMYFFSGLSTGAICGYAHRFELVGHRGLEGLAMLEIE